jgi:hypothetical protein
MLSRSATRVSIECNNRLEITEYCGRGEHHAEEAPRHTNLSLIRALP